MTKGITLVSLVAILVVSGVVVFFQNNEKPLEEHVSASATLERSASKAYIDPNTGKLTSTPSASTEPVAQGNSKLVLPSSNKLKPVETIQRPDGSTLIMLNGRGFSNDRVSLDLDCNSPAMTEYLKKKSLDITDCEAAK